MRTLLKTFVVLGLVAAAAPSPTYAAPFSVGEYIRMADGPGTTGGGEFTAMSLGESFLTFCLQRTEYINFRDDFLIESISPYAKTDPAANGGDAFGRDYLSAETAFLYTQFRLGTLLGYDYAGVNRYLSANKLQKAIWMFEQELPMDLGNSYVQLAKNAIASGAWSGMGNVRAMNLTLNGVESQDQLILIPAEVRINEVPEPASLVMFGTGLTTAAAFRRRSLRRRKSSVRL